MKKITIIAVVLVLIGGGAWYAMKGGAQQATNPDTVDAVTKFYNSWLTAAKDPAATPGKPELAASAILSKDLRARLASAVSATPDPVLCQAKTPQGISIRSFSNTADKAQVLVTPKDKSVNDVALVTLLKSGTGWYISDINCSAGDVAPEKEFSFENVGYLIKNSVPKPYNSKNWHLVFEEKGQPGHVVPLLFDAKSQCVALDGKESACSPSQFKEATKVSIHGQMSEAGVTVVRLEFVK
ncbi:hypothetical protein KW784_01295 [Candidatus Parcubacteria bacterium]|nr:hypothetical protein [Candidatus Parcubacteria bacterium]